MKILIHSPDSLPFSAKFWSNTQPRISDTAQRAMGDIASSTLSSG